ncbi:nickel permease [Deinococcus malanensis]|uniref:Nickel/cobalt efflux system n=1 Tax=Deinococcus malanensis TaxID=1706855 RepID=A0ABQ2ER56_9DEIO|nr:nickel transporter [Deinococcus malanensis]GGK17964.1 nickel permease [Deinococcus malanensis]
MIATLALVFMLGMRHGMDADHLAAIDGFARLRPSRWTGVLFGLGHGLVVTVLALVASSLGDHFGLDWLAPYLFLGVAALNLWRLVWPVPHSHAPARSLLALGPFVVGLLLAVGMETSSQLAALSMAQSVPPLLLGLTFTLGMTLADGADGLLAAQLQRGRNADPARAALASRVMGWMVVALSLAFALAGFTHVDLGEVAAPLGMAVFVMLLALRVWSRLTPRQQGVA